MRLAPLLYETENDKTEVDDTRLREFVDVRFCDVFEALPKSFEGLLLSGVVLCQVRHHILRGLGVGVEARSHDQP